MYPDPSFLSLRFRYNNVQEAMAVAGIVRLFRI